MKTKTQSETGWVIERGDSQPARPLYLAGPNYWSFDNLEAVRFARKEDADKFKQYANDRICEHAWD